jgi:type IV pilus assembly protein PilE
MRCRATGFTLIELMITAAIIVLLASIALPSYESYVLRTRRADAKTFLLGMAQHLERCFTRFGGYNHANCSVGAGPFSTSEGFYSVVINNRSTMTFTLTATPQGAQTRDTRCGNFAVNHLGQHTATGTLGNGCWDR